MKYKQRHEYTHSGQKGFSLLELLIVLAIVTLIVGVVPAITSSLLPSANIKAVSADLTSDLRRARLNAIEKGMPVSVSLLADGTGYRLSSQDGVRKLPSGMRLYLNRSTTYPGYHSPDELDFFSDGTSSGGTFNITAAQQSALVVVHWLTGAVMEPKR